MPGPRKDMTDQLLSKLLTSLTHENFMWVSSSQWEQNQIRYFVTQRPKAATSLFMPIPFISSAKKHPAVFIDRWVLLSSHKDLFGWAEVQYYPKAIKEVMLLCGQSKEKDAGEAIWEPIKFLISAIFLASDVDQVKLIFAGTKDEQMASARQDLSIFKRQIFSVIPDQFLFSVLKRTHLYQVENETWWQFEDNDKHRKQLDYLVNRQKRLIKNKNFMALKKVNKRQKKLPWWRKLFFNR